MPLPSPYKPAPPPSGFIDPLISNGLQHSELTDGFAAGITILVTLVGLPATGIENQCRHLLRHPDRPEKWQPPGLPDATAGEWPVEVSSELAQVVVGLTEKFPDDRMPLSEALGKTSVAMDVASSCHPRPLSKTPATTGGGGGGGGGGDDDERSCVICEDAPRQVRFRCGHALCCFRCLAGLRESASAKSAANPSRPMPACCPQCGSPIGEDVDLAESGPQVGAAPTFVMPPRGASAAPPAGRGGRGGRGRGQVGRGGRGVNLN